MPHSHQNEPDFAPTARPKTIRLRARLLRRLRDFFGEHGFLEVETPLLSADTVVDRHIDPVSVMHHVDPRNPAGGQRFWLQTSPEFHMKRMLATGQYDAIFQITRAFRAGERGTRHNPEFTMVEWYRVGDDMAAGMKRLSDLAADLLAAGEAECLSHAAAFMRYAGIDPRSATAEQLLACAVQKGLHPPQGLDRDGLLDFLMVELVEPNLGRGAPSIIHSYPPTQAALARTAKDETGAEVAERFELYVDGFELANGYHELLDADELRRRNESNNQLRTADGKMDLPIQSRLLDAMDHGLPACTGVALGFDRLVMVAAGATSIDQVLTFPIERA